MTLHAMVDNMNRLDTLLKAYVACQDGELNMIVTRAKSVPLQSRIWDCFAVHKQHNTVILYNLIAKRKYILTASLTEIADHAEYFLVKLIRTWYLSTNSKSELVDKMLQIAQLLRLKMTVHKSQRVMLHSYVRVIKGLQDIVVTSDYYDLTVVIPSRNLRFQFAKLRHYPTQQFSCADLALFTTILDFMF